MQRLDMARPFTVLGIESTCDETAAAVLRDVDLPNRISSSIVYDQLDLHASYGGVVPEIAARAHAERLDMVTKSALLEAEVNLREIDAIAVSAGPGLIGGVLSGVAFAKGLAVGSGIPLVGVNHLAGHALTPRLTDGLPYPYLMLLVSGGHCQILIVSGPDSFLRVGGTIDDAPGEAFDKTARILGLPQPGGPSVERAAANGDPKRFALPRPLLDRAGCDMSFSGLKTAVFRTRDSCIELTGGLTERDRSDLCACFQSAVTEILQEKSRRAIESYLKLDPEVPTLTVAGGVAANRSIRSALETLSRETNVAFNAPPLELCTDNAAMIGWAGLELFRAGHRSDLTLTARPRWPLDEAQTPILGSGRKGAKA